MSARALKTGRIVLLLSAAFLLGGASTEVALRTHRAVERVRVERELGTAGQLVALQLTGPDGEVVARPRIIAPAGKAAELVLHDPARPGDIRVAFRVEAERSPTGDISLEYELWIPERALTTRGTVCLTPAAAGVRAGRGNGLEKPCEVRSSTAWLDPATAGFSQTVPPKRAQLLIVIRVHLCAPVVPWFSRR